jgi:GDP-mannose 6-dehydrogenase
VDRVCAEVGKSLGQKQDYHVVVVRSTVPPGTVQDRLLPILEQHSHRRAGADFGVCMNPEFLREGSAIKDFYHPAYTLIGELDARSGDALEQIYKNVNAPIIRTGIPIAEMTKYVCNAFHALKITFANEIGTLCKSYGVDGQQLMEIFCQDERLNISSAYLRPGFAFGGSCLPKDARTLVHMTREREVDAPVLGAILSSNQRHVERAIQLVESANRQRIGVLGLSFKPATDDVRESPTVTLVETLVGRGYEVSVYDETIDPEKLTGVNRVFLERALPHIASHMRSSMEQVVEEAEVLVIANGSPCFQRVPPLLRNHQILIDLVGIVKEHSYLREAYEGICW